MPDTSFHRLERRYLLDGPDLLRFELGRYATPMEYSVTSLYLDLPQRTWSRGEGGKKWRLRNYDQAPEWWIETKERDGDGMVDKARQLAQDGAEPPEPLEVVAAITYDRTAFDLDNDLRVTIDRDVTSDGKVLGCLVVETKGEVIPDWLGALLPPESRDFSKSKWALGRVGADGKRI